MPHAVMSSALAIREGVTLGGQYRLGRQLGSGGMGSVWLAHDFCLKRDVAIKFLEPHQADAAAAEHRFRREALFAGKIHSPHVVQIFAQGWTAEGRPYIVMELLNGEDLGSRLSREGPLDPARALSILEQVSVALAQAHQQGLVHRDIKPSNIFLVPERNERVFVKLLDFGVAKDIHTPITKLTLTGAFIGTLFYISPEQLAAPNRVGPSADIWATAVTAYEMLTGSLPFGPGAALPELLFKISRGSYVRASTANPRLPKSLDLVFQKAFRADPRERFATIEELCTELSRILFNDPGLRPTLSGSEAPEFLQRLQHEVIARQHARQRNRYLRMLAALSVVMLCGVAVLWQRAAKTPRVALAKPQLAAATPRLLEIEPASPELEVEVMEVGREAPASEAEPPVAVAPVAAASSKPKPRKPRDAKVAPTPASKGFVNYGF